MYVLFHLSASILEPAATEKAEKALIKSATENERTTEDSQQSSDDTGTEKDTGSSEDKEADTSHLLDPDSTVISASMDKDSGLLIINADKKMKV